MEWNCISLSWKCYFECYFEILNITLGQTTWNFNKLKIQNRFHWYDRKKGFHFVCCYACFPSVLYSYSFYVFISHRVLSKYLHSYFVFAVVYFLTLCVRWILYHLMEYICFHFSKRSKQIMNTVTFLDTEISNT